MKSEATPQPANSFEEQEALLLKKIPAYIGGHATLQGSADKLVRAVFQNHLPKDVFRQLYYEMVILLNQARVEKREDAVAILKTEVDEMERGAQGILFTQNLAETLEMGQK